MKGFSWHSTLALGTAITGIEYGYEITVQLSFIIAISCLAGTFLLVFGSKIQIRFKREMKEKTVDYERK